MDSFRVALVGDYNLEHAAHRAIDRSFELLRASFPVESIWIGTERIAGANPEILAGFSGVWCVPASPYRSEAGALAAIQFARENRIPFLGTCGGSQHALIECARNMLGKPAAAHAEIDPDASSPLIHKLVCPLVEVDRSVYLTPGSRLAEICGCTGMVEGYHCSYGLNPEWPRALESTGWHVSAKDEDGDVRAMERHDHPFFHATLFQPERAALRGVVHPLVRAFVEAGGRARSLQLPAGAGDSMCQTT